MPGGTAVRVSLPKGESGRTLCRWCALEVPRGRYTFCSEWCVHEWRLRTNAGYLREQVLRRDRGICAVCRVNTLSAFLRLKKARGVSRAKLLDDWGLKRMTRRSLWDADHVLPVAEGGGECDLRNIRTLCLKCHRLATAELRARLSTRKLSSPATS
jgi:5-methylcytosine-specific restriction enzyme A